MSEHASTPAPAPAPSLPFDRPDPLQPPPRYAELQGRTPVAAVTTPDGRRAWLVTSYDTAAAVLADPRFGMAPPGTPATGNDTLFQDGEPHLRLRRLVSRAFSPRSIAALGPRIHELAAGHVAALATAGPPADLVAGLAAPLPLQVISELLGVAIDEQERFRSLVEAVGSAEFSADDGGEGTASALRAWHDLTSYAAGLVAAKRAALGDDLLSALIEVRDTDEGRLSDDELTGMVTTLVAAGYQTARNGISVGTLRLVAENRLAGFADVPDEQEETVEEVLRRLAGLIAEPFPRWAHADLELDGVPIAAGDPVLVRLEAANHDPRHFADPHRFLPRRHRHPQPAGPHLAFGRGPHHCLGAPLARIELSAAFRALSRQLPGLRLHVPLEDLPWTRGRTDAGPTAVPVAW